MSEFLIIRPTLSEPRKYTWFSYDEVSHNILAQGQVDSLADLLTINNDSPQRPVVLLYPTDACKLASITWPTRLKKREVNALLFSLEDDLSDDIENFSVAVLNRQGNKYDVLVYKTEELKSLEEALTLMGFSVDFIVPDVLALPLGTKVSDKYDIVALRLEDNWLFRTDVYQGIVIENDLLEFAKEKFNHEVSVSSLSEVPETYAGVWEENLCDNPLAVLADGAIKSKVNLSNKHQKKSLQLKFLQSWIKVVVLVIAVFVLWNINIDYRTKALVQETNAYKNNQRSLFSEIMPGTGRAKDPVAVFRQYISEKTGLGTDEGYLDLLNMISPKLVAESSIEMVSMKFDRSKKTFILHFLAPEDFDMDRFKGLFSEDFTVDPQTAKPSRDKMLHSVLLRRNK